MEENLTLQKAYDLACSVETANKQASELQVSTRRAVAVQQVAPPRPVSTVEDPLQLNTCCPIRPTHLPLGMEVVDTPLDWQEWDRCLEKHPDKHISGMHCRRYPLVLTTTTYV